MSTTRSRCRHLRRMQQAFRANNYVTDGQCVFAFDHVDKSSLTTTRIVLDNDNNDDNDDNNDTVEEEVENDHRKKVLKLLCNADRQQFVHRWRRVCTLKEFANQHSRGHLSQDEISLLEQLFLYVMPVLAVAPVETTDGDDDETLQLLMFKQTIEQTLLLNEVVPSNDGEREGMWTLQDGKSLYIAYYLDGSSNELITEQTKRLKTGCQSSPCKWYCIGLISDFVRDAFCLTFPKVRRDTASMRRICIAAECFICERVSFLNNLAALEANPSPSRSRSPSRSSTNNDDDGTVIAFGPSAHHLGNQR